MADTLAPETFVMQVMQVMQVLPGRLDQAISGTLVTRLSPLDMDQAHYYTELAAAYARGRLHLDLAMGQEEALAQARAAGLRLHRFKRNAELPRIRKVLGTLRGFAPESLLDVGSGRGTFLWPLLEVMPALLVTAIDQDAGRARNLQAVAEGGVTRLCTARMDAADLRFPSGAFDGVTLLEVLEHLERPERAVAEAVRVARRFVLVSVPSKPDDNPEHLRLFDAAALEQLLLEAGATRVRLEQVRGHYLASATRETTNGSAP